MYVSSHSSKYIHNPVVEEETRIKREQEAADIAGVGRTRVRPGHAVGRPVTKLVMDINNVACNDVVTHEHARPSSSHSMHSIISVESGNGHSRGGDYSKLFLARVVLYALCQKKQKIFFYDNFFYVLPCYHGYEKL